VKEETNYNCLLHQFRLSGTKHEKNEQLVKLFSPEKSDEEANHPINF